MEIVRSVLDCGCIQVVMIVFAQTWQVIAGKREGRGLVAPKPWGRFVHVGEDVIGAVECIGWPSCMRGPGIGRGDKRWGIGSRMGLVGEGGRSWCSGCIVWSVQVPERAFGHCEIGNGVEADYWGRS